MIDLIFQNQNDLKGIIVVEKDTIFQRLASSAWFQSVQNDFLLITAKGYPDQSTRSFVKMLLQYTNAQCVYLGDSDPFGADIYFQYQIGQSL